MNSGVPVDVKKYSHSFRYNDVNSLEVLFKKYKNKVACVILEPISKVKPICQTSKLCTFCKKEKRKKCSGFLKRVKELAKKNNALLIFDEIVTGFRFGTGGYQKICKITPDLSCFSKAMANGFPIAALVGKKKIMSQFDGIYYSLTFAGETMSLAASIKTIQLLKKYKVCEYIQKQGTITRNLLENKINDLSLEDFIKIMGHPGKLIFAFYDYKNISGAVIRLYWIKRLAELGVLTNGTQILNYSHNKNIVNELIKKYLIVLKEIKKLIENDFFLKLKNKIELNKNIREI
jgi:glutamate-1-semialdehyde aminotransferase